MINLLPPEVKSGYVYARRNVGLRKWLIVFVIALLGLGGLGTYGLVTLRQAGEQYDRQIAATEARFETENYAQTQKRIKDIGDSFKLVVKVLSQEVLFSQLLNQIATTIPAQANLSGLNISQTQGALDITVNAVDYNTATQAQVNLADPSNKIFSKADIVNISCESAQEPAAAGATEAESLYPCTVNIKALFSNNNSYLFINSKGTRP